MGVEGIDESAEGGRERSVSVGCTVARFYLIGIGLSRMPGEILNILLSLSLSPPRYLKLLLLILCV